MPPVTAETNFRYLESRLHHRRRRRRRRRHRHHHHHHQPAVVKVKCYLLQLVQL